MKQNANVTSHPSVQIALHYNPIFGLRVVDNYSSAPSLHRKMSMICVTQRKITNICKTSVWAQADIKCALDQSKKTLQTCTGSNIFLLCCRQHLYVGRWKDSDQRSQSVSDWFGRLIRRMYVYESDRMNRNTEQSTSTSRTCVTLNDSTG